MKKINPRIRRENRVIHDQPEIREKKLTS